MTSSCNTWAVGLAAAAVVTFGCATAPARRDAGAERLCFDRREVNVIRALDEGHALVKVSAGRFYLLTVDKTCTGLALARTVAIVEATSRVCADGYSFLSFADPTVGPIRCRVETIDAVADQNAAMDLIESRREK